MPTASPNEAAAPEATYRTRPGDTLHGIARRMQADGISLEQMLVGLYRANRNAFVDDNMNRLMVGKIIQSPQQDELRALSREEAVREIRLHAENWNAYRSSLASAVARAQPETAEAPRQHDAGRITAATEDKAAPAPGGPRDVVRLSQGDPPAAAQGRGAASDEKVRSLEEEAIAQDRAIQEVTERIAFFEQQIRDMQQLLLVQNQILAELQKGGRPDAPAGEAAHAAPAAPEAAPAPLAVAQPPAETDMLATLPANPALLGGAGALLALLGGTWLYLRGRRRRVLDSFEQGILTAGGLKLQAAGAEAGTQERDTAFLSGFATQGGEGLIDAGDVDPVSEAEVYMAYGRDTQAEEILKDAIAKTPVRHELHLKLLEIYARRKDAAAFDRLAGELYATLGSASPIWKKVAEMGRTLEPGNPLYAVAAGAALAAAAAVVAEAEPETGSGSVPVPESAVSAEGEQAQADERVLDFDLGLLAEEESAAQEHGAGTEESGAASAEGAAPRDLDMPVVPEAAGSEVASTESADLEFELAQILPEPPASGTVQLEAEELGMTPEEAAPATFDLGMPPEEPAVAGKAPAEPAGQEASSVLAAAPEPIAETAQEILLELPELPEPASAPAAASVPEPPELGGVGETGAGGFEPATSGFAEPVESIDVSAGAPEIFMADEAVQAPSVAAGAAEAIEAAVPGGEIEEILIERPAAETAGLDFNFAVDVGAEPEPAPAPGAAAQPLHDLDLSAISLDLGEPAAVEEEITLSAAESPDVDTKLDLVTAYMDMGDSEGARELLEEVLREGGPNQRERARKMLDTLT